MTSTTSDSAENPTFDSLKLSKKMRAALERAGYEYPTPIQAGFIPKAIEGIDLVGQARTGTGKTAAFAIPILEFVDTTRVPQKPEALVLTPTRELAVQVQGEFEKLAHGRRIESVAVYGGKPIRGQIEKLKRGPQVVVGTPGRLIDHIERGSVRLDDVAIVVLDEADRMLDIGFRPDIERILRRCPEDRQTLLLSATMPPPIQKLAERYMHEPEMLNFIAKEEKFDTIDQYYFTVDPKIKFDLLLKLLKREEPAQAIIFCRTKRGTERIGRRLAKQVASVGVIHGDLDQRARDRVMKDFREKESKLLVATDVVGRGIDISGVSHIINYDIPQFSDDYVHRVGRTGRMGREGIAFTFVSPEEGPQLTRIEQRIEKLLKRDEIKGFSSVAAPISTGGAGDEEEPKRERPDAGRRQKRYRRAL